MQGTRRDAVMAKVITPEYTDTAIAGNPTQNFVRANVNFAADFRVKSNNGKEVILTNITSPIDCPENIRLAYTDVANIYSGTGIDPSVNAPTKRGISVLAQITDVLTVTDDADADYRVDLPLSAHLVIKVPSSEFITSARVQTLVARLLSSLYSTGVTTTTRLDAILRGSLVSSDV
jgi:hypothetical protein